MKGDRVGRIAGRRAARMHRQRPGGGAVAKVYHQRTRDGERVVWSEDGGRLKLMAPWRRASDPERVAVEILADVVGRRRAWPLAGGFAEWLAAMGPRWDLTERDIRMWADGG